jgi:hypothetical protein
MYMPFPM